MHGSDSVEADLSGNFCKTSSDVQLSHELFTVIKVLEVHLQLVAEKLLIGWQLDSSNVL